MYMVEFIECIEKEPKYFRVGILSECIGTLQDSIEEEMRNNAELYLDSDYDDKTEALESMLFYSAVKFILNDFELYDDVLYRSTLNAEMNDTADVIESRKNRRRIVE